MPHDVCIFCERAKPLVKITKEHLFSRWVDDVLTPDLLGPDRSFERTTAGRDGFTATKTWSTEVIATIEAAVVCGGRRDGCNGGWMSELDGQVRQLLEPMMLGKPRKPTPEDQLTIAAWAAMKSMVLEYSWGPDQVIVVPQAARTFVFRQRRAPGSMQIRVAAVESQGRPALFARASTSSSRRRQLVRRFQALPPAQTLVLGCFVVQTYGTSMTGPAASQRSHGRDHLVMNPPSGVDISWPPPDALDDRGMDRFAHPLQPVTGD